MEFVEELRRFRERAGRRGAAGLILPGSRQATTAALLIGALRPRRVAFLLTPDTLGMPDAAARLLGVVGHGWSRYAADHSDTLAVYRALRAIITAWADLPRARIAVDLTGGTKPMSVGLAKAAYVLGIEALYIESDFAPDAAGRPAPVPGTQRLAPPPDPYLVFGDLEAAEAARLYAAHDYAGAERVFGALRGRLAAAVARPELARRYADALPDLRRRAERYAAAAELAAAYRAWDGFDLAEARARLAAHLALARPAGARRALLEAQAAALLTLTAVTREASGRGPEALATLADPERALPLLGSLYANAGRRAAQGRYDTAALLLYRCLELIAQHRLATWGVLNEAPQFAAALARVPDLEPRYERVQREQGRGRLYGLPERAVGLFVGYMLLAALDDELVRGFAIARIERRTGVRNRSILAHGYRLISADEYQQFADVVEEVLDRLFAVLGRERAGWARLFAFAPLEDV